MFCPNCGYENGEDALFCENCGVNLAEAVRQSEAEKTVILGAGKDIQDNNESANAGYGQANGYAQNAGYGQANGYAQNAGYGQESGYAQNSGYGPTNGYAQNGVNVQKPASEKKPISKWIFVVAAEVIVILICAWTLKGIIGNINTPERTAENYFVHVANGEWEEAYKDLDIEEIANGNSDFVNSEMYSKGQAQKSLGIVSNYQVAAGNDALNELNNVLEGISGGDSLGQTIRIDYRAAGDTENSVYVVSLNNTAKNKWKVGVSDLLCRDYRISVLSGASVSVDGIDLGAEYFTETTDYMDSYTIPYLFYGIHEIKVSMEDMEDVVDTVSVDYSEAYYYCDRMLLKEEVLDTLIQKAGENMQQIYSAAIAGKNLKTIKELFTVNEESMESIKESYGYLLSGMNEGSSQIKNINFYNVKGQAYVDSLGVEISFDYKIDYTYEDWWSGNTENDVYEGSEESIFSFVKENGNWVQTNLGCNTLYY